MRYKNQRLKILLVLIIALALPHYLFGAMPHADMSLSPCSRIEGKIIEEGTGEPLGWCSVFINELHHGISTDADGRFTLDHIPPGEWTLQIRHIGYREAYSIVNITCNETVTLNIVLSPYTYSLDAVEVLAQRDTSSILHRNPVVEMDGGELQRELGITIAETVDETPGTAVRSMGPAPARPVLRGMSGDRLMLLEDGNRTGDLSATSADHAVAIEPMTAERVEIIRGPEALPYSSNVMGGVVNVQRNSFQLNQPDRLQGFITLQGESVNHGGSAGGMVRFPVGPLTIRMDGSLRSASDIRTPSGTLNNTDIQTTNSSASVSLDRPWGNLGMSGSIYDTEYGIPGGFVGAHPNGVSIEMDRRNMEMYTHLNLNLGPIRHMEMEYSFARYYHAEYESNGSLGMEFGVLSDNASLNLIMDRNLIFDGGIIGFWGELRDYATGGFTYTPATDERQAAVYLYEKMTVGNILIDGGLRYDVRVIDPDKEVYSVTIDTIRQRSFHGLSGSLRGEISLDHGFTVGAMLTRSFRPPTVEELFSRGPHLAAYSYEIGNPDLNAEHGTGIEGYLQYRNTGFEARLSIFHNRFSSYIFPGFSGERSRVRSDLYEYHYIGDDAALSGFEATSEIELSERWLIQGLLSYVRGELIARETALPLIPPINGSLRLIYRQSSFSFTTELVGSGEQIRLYRAEDPDAIPEEATSAWMIMNLSGQYYFPWNGKLNSFVVSIENVLDTEYRNHLSRVKSVMPEPGRNIKLLYRLYF